MRRYESNEQEWKLVEPHTQDRAGSSGGRGRHNRCYQRGPACVQAAPDVMCLSGSGRGTRCRGASAAGRRGHVGSAVAGRVGARLCWILIDSTTVKVHKAAAESLGRSRSGLGTKEYAMVDAPGNGLHLGVTLGAQADSPQRPTLLAALPGKPGAVVADKAYDTNPVRQAMAAHEAEPVILPKANWLAQLGL